MRPVKEILDEMWKLNHLNPVIRISPELYDRIHEEIHDRPQPTAEPIGVPIWTRKGIQFIADEDIEGESYEACFEDILEDPFYGVEC